MVISKEILTDYKEIYEKAIQLVNEESKNDPPTDLFRSHYAARDLLLGLREELSGSIASAQADDAADSNDDEFTYKAILAFIYRDLGRIYVYTEELSIGEQILKDCLALIEEYKLRPEAIIAYMGSLNELGTVHANRQENKEAYKLLKKSESTFQEFKEAGKSAMSITDIFGTPEEVEIDKGNTELEKLYTMCAFYLAQVCGHLGELEESGEYCHLTLKRQLESKTYEPIGFALDAATLSQYFIGQNMFKEARHHLAAATLIISEYETKMITPEMTEQQRNDTTETFKHRYADVARCWAKYGLVLLSASKERLYNDDDSKLATDAKRLTIDPKRYQFPDLEVSTYENRITADYCLTFDDAKLVYLFVNSWLDEAKSYYKLETEATEYAKIIKDSADLYLYMAFFEENTVNQSKMYKRRAKYYEELLKELNPVFYLSICRECWYFAGISYCSILDILLDELKLMANPAPEFLQKINKVCMKAIKHFLDFIKSYTEKDEMTIKANVEVDELRTVMSSFFYLGRLYYKLITPDHTVMLENLTNSLKYYKKFTDECTERKEAAEPMQAELGVCREMVNLLPMKINNIKKRFNL